MSIKQFYEKNKKKVIIAALGLAGLVAMPSESHSQIKGNIEANISKEPLVETNFFYGNEKLRTNGFTFLDYYFKDGGYFGKSTLNTKISKNLSAETQVYHINEPFSKAGIGMNYEVPIKNKDLSLNAAILPLWMNKEGNLIKNNVNAKYFISYNLPKGFSIKTFGQFAVNSKGGPQWKYGEIDLSKKLGENNKWVISYNPSLTNREGIVPKYTHRIALRRKF